MSSQLPLSPDGRYMWNGQQWVPNPQARTPPTNRPTPTPPKRKRRWWLWGCVTPAAGLLALIIIISVIASAANGGGSTNGGHQANTSTPPTTAKPAASTPTPTPKHAPAPTQSCQGICAVHNGVTLTVTNVQYGWQDPEGIDTPDPGNVYVVLQVTISNHSSSNYEFGAADPLLFSLQDASGLQHDPTILIDDPATEFDNVTLLPGATQSETYAFQARANEPTGLILIWHHLDGDQKVKIS